MQYREFGQTGEKVSLLGFGCMRLPVINGVHTDIDYNEAIKMLRHAVDKGVNYIDTAYPYHGTGMGSGGASEPFVAKALKDGYREKVNLATKLPTWLCKSRADMDRLLDEQLQRLETETIDFYLIHTLNKILWPQVKEYVGDFIKEAKSSGKIRYAGFSFHDDADTFIDVVDAYDWDFCQIQYNYLDTNFQAGKKGLEYAAQKGLGVVIMEPLRGGGLAGNIPDDIIDNWKKIDEQRTPVQWALRWVMNHPEVSVVLSGMTTMEQVEDNLKTTETMIPECLTTPELESMEFAKSYFEQRMKINCTGCRYCMPCPSGVDIPQNFTLYNTAYLFDMLPISKVRYNAILPDSSKASRCVECGACEEHCPQNIPIISELKNVVKALA